MAYKIYCRHCSWTAPNAVDLKGEANWIAGRHISQTGHSVALEEVDEDTLDKEFVRSPADRNPIEILRPEANPTASSVDLRHCGSVVCTVESIPPTST